MASEELPEPVEEKKASHEAIDLQAINNSVSTEIIKEQMQIKSNVVDENTVNHDVDFIKKETEVPSKLGISVEPNQVITEKPEILGNHPVNLEEELKEQEVQKYEECTSPIVESTREQEKINGKIENGVHSNQFTEEASSEVIKGDGIPANGTSFSSEEIQEKSDSEPSNIEKIDSEEVTKEDAPQSQIPEKDEAEKDVIQSNSATLSDKDCQKEVEIPVGDAKQNPEEYVTTEVEIPSTTTPPVTEEVSEEAKGKNDILEEVEQEKIYQTEVAKENLAEEKECQDETENESRGVSKIVTAEETILEEANRENKTLEMSSEEIAKNEGITAKAEMDETGLTDNGETITHEDSTSYDQPITDEENNKSNGESEHLLEEVKENDVPVTATPLILEEDKESAENNEETKEEAQQNKISVGDEIDKETSQRTPVIDLSETEHQNQTEKVIENASAHPEEQITAEVDLKEVESASVSTEVLEEEKEKVAEEVQKEQAAEENCAEEECPPDAGVQNSDATELVVSEETMPEEAIPESKTPNPEMISKEVKPTEDTIAMDEKDETRENDKEEDATDKDLTSSQKTTTNEEPKKTDEYSQHISDESTLETTVSREVAPEIENTDSEKTLAAETDNMDIKEIENEDEAKSYVELEPDESSHAPIKIEEATLNDCEEEKQVDDKLKHIGTNDEQEVKPCLMIEEQLEESKPSTSEEELSSEKEAIERKPIEETGEGEQNIAQNKITLDSIETVGNDDEVANCDEKDEETREINLAAQHDTSDDINRDEVGKGDGQDEEANKKNVEELQEDEKIKTNEPDEMVQNFEVDEKREEILSGNIVTETTPSIQNEEDPPEKDENIKNEITEEEHITEVECSTEVTEGPAAEVKNSFSERSYEQDQLIPEKASEQDNLQIAPVSSEIEIEKPEICNASSQGEVADSVIPQTDDKSELEVEPKEKTEEETLTNEEVTQKVEEVEEPCISSHGKEELPEEESTTAHEEISAESSISTIQQDQQIEESDAEPTEANNATDDFSVEQGSEANTTLISSIEQINETSIDREGVAITQEENNVEAPNEEAEIVEELEESSKEIDQITDPSKVTEVELKQSETVAPETEILEVTPNEKLEDESNPRDRDAKSAELENTTEKSTEQEEISIEPSNTRELQIDQTEVTAEQDQPNGESDIGELEATDKVSEVENSEVSAELGANVEQIEDVSVDKEESVVLQEDADVPEEEAQKIETENEKHIEEVPQITSPSEVTEVELNQTETIPHETEILEVVSNEELAVENILTGTDVKLAKFESTTEEPTEEKEIANESSNTRELQVDQPEIISKQDQLSQESEVKPAEPEQVTEEVPTVENSKVDATVSESSKEIGERLVAKEESMVQEEDVGVEIPGEDAANEKQIEEEVPQITKPSEVTEVELNQSETVPPETEILEAFSNEELGDENKLGGTDMKLAEFENTTEEPTEEKEIPTEPKLAGVDIKLVEFESTTEEPTEEKDIPSETSNTRELKADQAEIVSEQDQPSQESEVKPTEPNQATEEVSTMENSEADATVSESAKDIGERLFPKEESVVQEEDVAVEMPEEEALNEKQIEEVSQMTNPSVVTEVELNQSETVPPKTKILEAVSNEELDDENKLSGADIKLAEFESTTEEPTEEKDIPSETSNTRELKVDQAEIISEQDQSSQESEVKPTEPDQATEEVSTMENSEADATVSESAKDIGERLVPKEESVVQEEDVAVEMPEEEASNEKQIEEVSQMTNPSVVTEVELNQSETVPPETKILEAVSNEELGDENKLSGADIKLAEFESTTEEPIEEKDIPSETSNTRELKVDQAEIISEQDQSSQELEVKPTEPDQAIEEVSTMENSEVDTTLNKNTEEIREESVAKAESLIVQEEDVAVEMPEEEAENEKHIEEEVSQVVHPSEITEDKLAETETVGTEASDEKIGDESGLADTELKSDQMENNSRDGLINEEPNASLTLSVEQNNEKSEENEVLPEITGEQVGEEKVDAEIPKEENREIEAAEEPCDEHIKGEIHRTADPETDDATEEELKAELTEKEVDPQNFETQTESPEQEKVTEESASVEEKTEATATLVPGETQTEETESGILPQSIDESVIVSEENISQKNEQNEEEIPTTVDSEICDSVEVESNAVLNEKELDPPICETQTESPEQERETDESALPVEKSVATAPSIPDERQIEEIEIANKENGVLAQSMPESVIQPEERISQEVEANEESSDKHIAGEISQIVPPTEISDIQSVESETLDPETENLEIISNEKLGDESEHTDNALKLAQKESLPDKLLEEKLNASLSPSLEQVTEKFEDSKVIFEPEGEQVQGEETNAEMPKEESGQGIEAADEPCDKHIEGEIRRTLDPADISSAAEESKAILTEEDVDSQKSGTETELPEQEETIEESTSIVEKSDATGSLLPGDEPQSTTESEAIPEERVSQEAETSEDSDQYVTRELKIISNEEEVHSDKHITEIEASDLERAAEELAEFQSADAASVVPGEGQVEEREIANKESSVAPESTIESVTVPEERVHPGIETYDKPSDKHIAGELHENDTPTDNFEASEEIYLVQEDKVEQAQITASPVEKTDSKNSGTEMESALLEKTNGEIDAKANVDEAGLTSFEGAIMNQTDNASETVQVVEQMQAEDQEGKGRTERDIDATVYLKTPEHKIAVDEINEHTEDTVPNFSEENKEVEEEAHQSEESEQDFASIVSSFLINKVLSEENQKVDDGTKQNYAASFIPKTLDDEIVQEVTTARNESDTRDEKLSYAISSREDLKPEQEQEEENAVKEVEENEQEDGVQQDYLPVSRFLMDKILRQEESKNPGKEVSAIEEPDKHVISDGGIQVQENFEENKNLVVAPEQNGEAPSSFSETTRDFEKGKTLIGEVDNNTVGDGAISSQEKIEETIFVEELPKQGEGNHSPIEVARDFEKEKKPSDEALEHIKDVNNSLVSDVEFSSVEVSRGEINSVGSVAEPEGERSISPAEAIRDFEKEDTRIEQKNEGIPITDRIEEIAGEVAVPKQGEKTLYPVQVRDFQHEEPAEEKDETLVSKVTSSTEEVEDMACREHSEDFVEETLVNAHEISNPEKTMEENKTVVMQKEEEHKDEAIADEETLKDVKNVEENYVFVEHEVNQLEVPKEILKDVADKVSDAAISNLEEEQTNLSAEIHNEKRSLVGQVEVVERGIANSTANCQEIEQSLPDVSKVPIVTEIVKKPVGNETDFIHGEEQVKEVTGTVESFENKSQEKPSEIETTKMEKKSEGTQDEEQEEEEEEEEEERHQERETEIIGRDLTVKSEVKETETKSAQKKSHNILSGVGSKVKHSFTKVKKAFTGKSKSSSPSAK